MTDWYAPNQQAVRADGSGPAEEGNGGALAPAPSAHTAHSGVSKGHPKEVVIEATAT
jgi:hypothetical protein